MRHKMRLTKSELLRLIEDAMLCNRLDAQEYAPEERGRHEFRALELKVIRHVARGMDALGIKKLWYASSVFKYGSGNWVDESDEIIRRIVARITMTKTPRQEDHMYD